MPRILKTPSPAEPRRRMLRLLGGSLMLPWLPLCGGVAAAAPLLGDRTRRVSVILDRTAAAMPIAPDFAGFSYEKDRLATGLFRGGNRALIALFRRLGPGLIRIGGNSVDTTRWAEDGQGATKGEIAPADVGALAAFLRRANWKVLYGLNLAANTPERLIAEATYAAKTLGENLHGFEIGNEPDYYSSIGLRPDSYRYADFFAEWSGLADALKAHLPNALVTGPGCALLDGSWAVPFAGDAHSRIALLTQHYYRGNGQNEDATLAHLLAGDPALPDLLDQLRRAVSDNGIPGYRLVEANSYSNGGAANISNAPGSALWVIDFLFTAAQYGAAGVNLHGGGDFPGYTPIADDGGRVIQIRPEYYGMLLFSFAARGRLVPARLQAGGMAISAYGVSDGADTHVVIVNKEKDDGIEAAIALGTGPASATVRQLNTAPGNGAGITFAGAAINAGGTWSPRPSTVTRVTNGRLTVKVPPMSAVLVTAA
jgi:hypothetical protein